MIAKYLWNRRGALIAAIITVLGLAEVAGCLVWVEWREFESTISPLIELRDLAVRVNGGPPRTLGVPIYVHPGDTLEITRSVTSAEFVNAQLERVFNTVDPTHEIDLPIVRQSFHTGVTRMDPVIKVPESAEPYMAYRYEVIAYDLKHAPKVFNDFTLCVLPPGVPPPAKVTLCAALRPPVKG